MKKYNLHLLPDSPDVTDIFNLMVKDRFWNGKKGLKQTNLFTHYMRMSINKMEIPFPVQMDDNVNTFIYLN